MSDLIGAELLRLWSRRLTWALLACVVATAALFTLASAESVRPLGPDDYKDAQAALTAELEVWETGECSLPENASECGEKPDLVLEHFLRVPDGYETYLRGALIPGLAVLIASCALASALIGAEATSGSLSTQLTFTPRRGRVLVAKTLVAVTGAVALMLAFILAVAVLGTLTFLLLRGVGDVAAGPELPLAGARLLVAALFTALLSVAFTFALGSTGAALGAGGAALVLSTMAASASSSSALVWRLLPTSNLTALLHGRAEYWVPSVFGEAGSTAMPHVPTAVIDFWQAAGYSLVLVAIATAVGAWLFRRRDLVR